MATKKYLIEKGWRAFPTDFIPDSKATNFSEVLRLGPTKCVMVIVKATNPKATNI